MRGARAAAAIVIVMLAGAMGARSARAGKIPLPDSAVARGLYEQLERKLLAAETVQFDARFESRGPMVSRLEGSIAIGSGDRAHIEQNGEMGGRPIALKFSSNGKALRVDSGEKSLTVGAAGKLNEALLLAFTRIGFLHQIYVLSNAEVPHWTDGTIREHVTVADFGLGDETTEPDGKICRTVRFQITMDGEHVARAALSLDRENGLPVRRTQEIYLGPDTMRVVENYDHMLLGAEVPAERFLVPNPR